MVKFSKLQFTKTRDENVKAGTKIFICMYTYTNEVEYFIGANRTDLETV